MMSKLVQTPSFKRSINILVPSPTELHFFPNKRGSFGVVWLLFKLETYCSETYGSLDISFSTFCRWYTYEVLFSKLFLEWYSKLPDTPNSCMGEATSSQTNSSMACSCVPPRMLEHLHINFPLWTQVACRNQVLIHVCNAFSLWCDKTKFLANIAFPWLPDNPRIMFLKFTDVVKMCLALLACNEILDLDFAECAV